MMYYDIDVGKTNQEKKPDSETVRQWPISVIV